MEENRDTETIGVRHSRLLERKNESDSYLCQHFLEGVLADGELDVRKHTYMRRIGGQS